MSNVATSCWFSYVRLLEFLEIGCKVQQVYVYSTQLGLSDWGEVLIKNKQDIIFTVVCLSLSHNGTAIYCNKQTRKDMFAKWEDLILGSEHSLYDRSNYCESRSAL